MKLFMAALLAVLLSTAAQAQSPYFNQGHYWRHEQPPPSSGFMTGVGGFVGGMIGGMLARPQPQPVYDPVAYCIQRFRSYNAETGYYLGFDGRYRSCP